MHDFVYCNHLEDVFTQKYKEIDEIRQEYPDIVQVFKNSQFSADIIKGLSLALDDLGDRPLIVRSSSLLEDRFGAAFSGKYKSLFLANRGTKQQRLSALTDAIAEVYASTFAPDPIQYRAERNLLDFQEGMGVLIQEVVGAYVGDYFLPAFAGVAFSHNEFRWSPRIRREDGLVRLVPGLGTRAVDRLGDDFPTLISPGQPGLRANATPDEVVRYSPRYMDVINLNTNQFETVEVTDFLRRAGDAMPGVEKLLSVYRDGDVRPPALGGIDFDQDDFIVTFEGLFNQSPFIKQVHTLLTLLERELRHPVDIEFASDGQHLYLLQCRAQAPTQHARPAPIPRDLARSQIVFSANRFVSNGAVRNVTHIVYVNPDRYAQLENREDLLKVGRAVGKLNKLLPKRQFILMGPGRWGSRGDIKLGVPVTYSDINNTAMLIEIARKTGDYTPDLSFGTHFFQDLVEAEIRYLPLYPDDDSVIFNDLFLTRSPNLLSALAPEFASLEDTIRVIDVPKAVDGRVLHVLMNADLDEAVAVLSEPTESAEDAGQIERAAAAPTEQDWRWRARMAECVAAHLDPARFGVKAVYLIGSTKNATAGPASDIDLVVHFAGTDEQRRDLERWLEGWSLSLSEVNFLRTGYRTPGLLDVHVITDDDVARHTSFAAKIDAVTDAARPLALNTATKP
jgi:predicted nucleotidyltransferase